MLRALAALATAVEVNWSDDRLLRECADTVHAVLGDGCAIRLTGDPAVEAVVSADEPAGAWLAAQGMRQSATFPLAGNNRHVGLLEVTRSADRPPFTAEEVAFGAALAALLGVLIVDRRILAHTTTAVDELRAQAEVVDQISDALITCDSDMRVLSWNAAAERIYGYAQSETVRCDLSALLSTVYLSSDGVPMTPADVAAAVKDAGRWDGELRERHANGDPLVVLSSMSAAAGGDGHLVLVNRDVTAQRHEEHLATHDALTGLPNRRRLNDVLHEAFGRARKARQNLALLFIDLDGFKPINDRYGHAAGDVVLTVTAGRLVSAVRRSDTVGRLGGDEFLVILENVGTDQDIAMVADRIVAMVREPIPVDGDDLTVHPSIGIAAARHPDLDRHTPDRLLAAADHAMYGAKKNGGHPVFA